MGKVFFHTPWQGIPPLFTHPLISQIVELLSIHKNPVEIKKEKVVFFNPMHASKYTRHLLFCLLGLASCKEKPDLQGEYLFRKSEEYFYSFPTPAPSSNHGEEEKVPKITKEHFRCKGSLLHPVTKFEREGRQTLYYRDCLGKEFHSLPLRDNKESIYPCLLEILNFLQEKTEKKVVITSGHRCPAHNSYCDPSPYEWGSKHMIGAEVDFYIEGMEESPQEVLSLIESYYQETPPFSEKKEFSYFTTFDRGNLNVSTPPRLNKEIFVKLYLPHEGRNRDTIHSHPYLGIQVRWDRDLDKRVTLTKEQSQNFYRAI
ncbi:MAG: hypothetical protein K940chlam9_00544 [Chlamydiae bacterium]|nr:hypothetical protein [Chlamydiota bacterium]